MKKIAKYKAFGVFAALVLVACFSCTDDFFEQPAGNRITPDQHYKTVEDNIASLNGINSTLQQAYPKLILLDGLLSDAMTTTSLSGVYLSDIEEHVFAAGNPYINTSDVYKTIININEVIINIPKVSELRKMDFDSAELHTTIGALVSLRANLYLSLVRLFGKAALIADNYEKMPDNPKQIFLSKEVMLDTLIKQIKPYIYDENSLEAEMFIPNTVNPLAVLGEIYLEKNDYANAVIYLKAAAERYGNNSNQYKVDGAYAKEKWKNIFLATEGSFSEFIFGVGFGFKRGQSNPVTKWTMYGGDYILKPSDAIINMFASQKQSNGKTDGDVFRGEGVSYKTIAGNACINKYSIDAVEPYSATIIVSRAADIHLLLAEALNRQGNTAVALAILNKGISNLKPRPNEYFAWNKNVGIRDRVSLQVKEPAASITDPVERMLAIEDLIIEERALELAFEGKRWSDLVRVAKRRNDPSYLANRVAAKFTNAAKAEAVKNKLMNPDNWYLPLY